MYRFTIMRGIIYALGLSLLVSGCSIFKQKSEATVTGVAVTYKLKAFVDSEKDSLLYVLDGMKSWPEEYEGKRVEVDGIVRKKKVGKYSDFVDYKLVIFNPRWKLLDQ